MGLQRPWSVCSRFLAEQHLGPTNSVARCQLTASCAQAVKPARQGARGQGPGREHCHLPWVRTRQLLPRSRLRKRLCRSELDPAGAWLRLAGGGPCGFGEVSPDISSGSGSRLRLWPEFCGTS